MARDTRTPFVIHALVIAVLASATAATAHADINGVPLCTATGQQVSPAITPDGSGGAIVAWNDARVGGGGRCYAQRVNAAGAPQWTANGVALSTTGDSGPPSIAFDGSGGAFVAYAGNGTVPRVQRVNAAGAPQWGADGVQLTTSTSVREMSIVRDVGGAGGAIVVWRDASGVGGTSDIGAQKVNSAGATQWGPSGIAVTATSMNSESHPAMISDGAGGIILVWFHGSGVRAGRLNAAGTQQWGNVVVSGVSNNMPPSIAADGTGGAVIAWSGATAIYAHRISAAGDRLWSPANGGVQLAPAGNRAAIISDGAGGATVAWQDFRTSTNYNIYAQRLSALGAAQWAANGVPVADVTDDQLTPGIVSDGGTGAIISWFDRRAPDSDIYAERIDATGAPLWTPNGEPVCMAINDQEAPVIATDAAGGAWVAWEDLRSGNADIYAQRIGPNGNVVAVPLEQSWIAARAWPNPFSAGVTLSFTLPTAARVKIEVFDVTGRVVRGLGDRALAAGPHVVSWDGRGDDGRRAAVGVYRLRVRGPGVDASRSVVRLR